MRKKLPLLALIFTMSGACTHTHSNPDIGPAEFPESPVNLGEINSKFDDYNSTAPFMGTTFPLCFSTNRNSQGGNFDIIYKLLDVYFSNIDGKLTIAENSMDGSKDVVIENANLNDALSKIRTTADELGPFLLNQGQRANGSTNWNGRYESNFLLYATHESGNLDIKFVENLEQETYNKPKEIRFLNSDKDDAYPYLMSDTSAIYFCSNRRGDFDIYKADLDRNKSILDNLNDSSSKQIIKNTILSSAGDDKCPYIFNNLMVFTSNRPGGFGGYDLYYSQLRNGEWTAPVNFGPAINTEYDEYRPIVNVIPGFTNDFMIFSSNRPGGKGGFDLYYVGISSSLKL